MDVFVLFIRLGLFAVFSLAALGKLFDPQGSRKAMYDFGVPASLVGTAVLMLPLIELSVAVGLIFIEISWIGSIGAAALLLIFSSGMAYQYAKGNAPDCHCFGQIHSEPVGILSIVRNLVLLAAAGFLVVRGVGGQGVDLASQNADLVPLAIGVTLILLATSALIFLKDISEKQRLILRRIELLEIDGPGETTAARDNVLHPQEGLPIGSVFPEFNLPDLTRKTLTLEEIKADRKPVLWIFISPSCTPCAALVPEFLTWEEQLKDKVSIVYVSSGDAKTNIEKFGGGSNRKILLQKDREYAEIVRAKWTPTAVYMDENGRVASHVAAGDGAIRELVKMITDADLTAANSHFASLNGHDHQNKIGHTVPAFSVEDVLGKPVTQDYFRGGSTLVAFWSLTCGYCDAMLSELREWDNTRSNGEPQLLVLSDGDIESNQKLGLSSHVVLDEGRALSTEIGMYGTPSAVVVDENGKIISEIAIGAPNIWALIGKN